MRERVKERESERVLEEREEKRTKEEMIDLIQFSRPKFLSHSSHIPEEKVPKMYQKCIKKVPKMYQKSDPK